MRPALKPGLLPVWRNRDTLQIGIDPRRAIALTGMRGTASLLTLLEGSRDRTQVLRAAEDLGIAPDAADRVLTLLAKGGALDDVPAHACRGQSAAARARLAPELATAALAHGDGDGGARTLARRQDACIRVHGAGPVGLRVAALLSSAGIGQVVGTGVISAAAAIQHGACWPGQDRTRQDQAGQDWTGQDRTGQDRTGQDRTGQDQAGQDRTGQDRPGGSKTGAPARALPPCRHHRHPSGPRPDLVVLADHHDRELPEALMRERIPHLAAGADEAIGVVGPLVTPGKSACLRCMDLTRADCDPAWPLILAQLAGRTADPAACDAVLAATVAAQTARQVLTHVDRGGADAVVNGTLELVLPGWQWRRRSWRPHPRCSCGSRGGS